MNFEPALVIELKTISELNDRIYPLQAPEESFDITTPYLIYASSEGLRTKTLGEGYRSGKAVRGELNVIAPRYADMKSITSDVIDLLIGFEGTTIATTGPFIQSIEYQEPVELWEDKPKLYRCVIEFEVYF